MKNQQFIMQRVLLSKFELPYSKEEKTYPILQERSQDIKYIYRQSALVHCDNY